MTVARYTRFHLTLAIPTNSSRWDSRRVCMKIVRRLGSRVAESSCAPQGGARSSWGVLALVAVAASAMITAGCSKQEAAGGGPRAAEVSALSVKGQTVPVTFQFVGQTESSQQVEIR